MKSFLCYLSNLKEIMVIGEDCIFWDALYIKDTCHLSHVDFNKNDVTKVNLN